MDTVLRILLSAAIGASAYVFVASFWGFYVQSSIFLDWAIEHLLLSDQRVIFHVLVFTHDLTINLLLFAPFAYVLCRLPVLGNWVYLAISLVSITLLGYWPVLASLASFIGSAGALSIGGKLLMTILPMVVMFGVFKRNRSNHAL